MLEAGRGILGLGQACLGGLGQAGEITIGWGIRTSFGNQDRLWGIRKDWRNRTVFKD